MDVGEIESLMGDGVGIRYQIFGPGSALATAGSSVTRLGDLAAVGGKDAYARNRATKISEPGLLVPSWMIELEFVITVLQGLAARNSY